MSTTTTSRDRTTTIHTSTIRLTRHPTNPCIPRGLSRLSRVSPEGQVSQIIIRPELCRRRPWRSSQVGWYLSYLHTLKSKFDSPDSWILSCAQPRYFMIFLVLSDPALSPNDPGSPGKIFYFLPQILVLLKIIDLQCFTSSHEYSFKKTLDFIYSKS